MPTIFLHVGPHKTGSTYLQNIFAEQAYLLETQGIVYPSIGREFLTGHHNIARFFSKRNLVNTYRSHLTDEVSKLSQMEGINLLFSSEEFSTLSHDELNQLKETFSRWDFHILYFLRNGSDLIISLWQESIKHGFATPLNEATLLFITNMFLYNPFNHDQNIAKYRQCLEATISVIDYNELLEQKQDLVYPTSKIINAILHPRRRRDNARLEQEFIELIRAANLYNIGIGRSLSSTPRNTCSIILKVPIMQRYLRFNLHKAFSQYHQTLTYDDLIKMGYKNSHLNNPDLKYTYIPGSILYDDLNKNKILPWRIIKKVIENRTGE